MRRKLVAAAAGVCGALLVLGFSSLTLINQSRALLAREATLYITSMDRLMAELDAALAELNARPPEVCGRNTVLNMRRAMVEHPGVDDMLFFPLGSMVPSCSANMGWDHQFKAMPEPLPVPLPRNQRQYWTHVPLDLFDGQVHSGVIKEGSFAVVTDFSRYVVLPSHGIWETYMPLPDGGFGMRSLGEEELHRRYLDARDNILRRGFYYNLCSTRAAACITLQATVPEIIRREGVLLLLVPLRALFLSGVLFFLVNRLLRARGTEKGRIKVALKRRQGFSCLYQPIVEIASGQPVGCEVLARFDDEFGPMMPDIFVPLMEELDSTWDFTTIIMETALAELAPLLDQQPDFGVSINFYPRDLTAERIPRLARCAALRDAAARRHKLHFEVIETAFGDLDSLSRTIDHLHSRGFLISIDDFGTGSSNLEQVQRLKADFVKIDRSFIRGLRPSSTSVRASLVPQIVEIARKVDVALVAEGVETLQQVQILKKLGVRLGQGYYFARPMPFETLVRFIEDSRSDTSDGDDTALSSPA